MSVLSNLSLIPQIPNMSLISQVPKMSLLPYLSKMSPLSYLLGQQGPSENAPMQSGGVGPQVAEGRGIGSAPVTQPTESSMLDLLKLVGLSGWGTVDEGGLATHAYPGSSGVPYNFGLPNMVQEVVTGEDNTKQVAPDAPYSFPFSQSAGTKGPVPSSMLPDRTQGRAQGFIEGDDPMKNMSHLPPWLEMLLRALPGLIALLRR